jgi:hypothetical protein
MSFCGDNNKGETLWEQCGVEFGPSTDRPVKHNGSDSSVYVLGMVQSRLSHGIVMCDGYRPICMKCAGMRVGISLTLRFPTRLVDVGGNPSWL